MNEEKEIRNEQGAQEGPKVSWELTADGMLEEKRLAPEEPEELEAPEEQIGSEAEPAAGEPADSTEDEDDAKVWSNLPRPTHGKQPKMQATIVSSSQEKTIKSSDGAGKRIKKREKKKSPKGNRSKGKALNLRVLMIVLIVLIVIALVFGAILLQQNGRAQSAMAKVDSGMNQGDGKGGDDTWNYGSSTAAKSDQSLERYKGDSSGVTMVLKTKRGRPVLSYEALYKKCEPSVVSVTVENKDTSGSGTGVILTADGYIITCAHVIADQEKATVQVHSGKEYKAKLVGSDLQTDLALLKIDASGLAPAEFGNAEELTVGDQSLAIGDPLGATFRGTLTNGIISAINRDVTLNGYAMNLIQTTAALNSGNSGGPLLNIYGQVVGINNMKMVSSSTTVEGLGFAVPTTTAKEIIDGLAKNGGISRPVLGVTCYGVDSDTAKKNDTKSGLIVASVNPASDCSAKGLQVGDIITEINGKAFTSVEDFKKYSADFKIGQKLTLTVYRPKKGTQTKVTTSKELPKATDYQYLGKLTVSMMDQQKLS